VSKEKRRIPTPVPPPPRSPKQSVSDASNIQVLGVVRCSRTICALVVMPVRHFVTAGDVDVVPFY